MKEPKTKPTKSLMDTMEELGQKYRLKVTYMPERRVRGIGILGGVGRQNHGPHRKPLSDCPGRQTGF
jgi:hypothetical protein